MCSGLGNILANKNQCPADVVDNTLSREFQLKRKVRKMCSLAKAGHSLLTSELHNQLWTDHILSFVVMDKVRAACAAFEWHFTPSYTKNVNYT